MAESLVVSEAVCTTEAVFEAVYTTEDGLGQPNAHQRQIMVQGYVHIVSVGSHEWCTIRITDKAQPFRGLLRG